MIMREIRDHFEGAGSGEGGEAVAAEELAGGDAHDRRSTFRTMSENRVTHGFVDLLRVLHRDGFVQLLIDFCN